MLMDRRTRWITEIEANVENIQKVKEIKLRIEEKEMLQMNKQMGTTKRTKCEQEDRQS